jgi:hypothetical protein
LIAMTLDAAGGALGDFDLRQRGDGFLSRPAIAVGDFGDAPPIARDPEFIEGWAAAILLAGRRGRSPPA